MADGIPRCMPPRLLQKLQALAERRCAHLIELQESGRWVRYYSQEDMVVHIKNAADDAGHWQQLCNTSVVPDTEAEPTRA
jgi:hypothetical protein